jgi:hypothetical protein
VPGVEQRLSSDEQKEERERKRRPLTSLKTVVFEPTIASANA